jgi:DNA uptake protein ComE-like DNA-binding protein
LGGFARKEQIMEVWGIDKELYDQIKSQLKVGKTQLKKININSCTIDELKDHPYIDYYVARSIVKYRQSHGKYKKTSDIMKSALVHEALYNKLKPYLSINKSLKNEE